MIDSENSYKTTARNIRAELIKRGEKFNSKLEMNFYLIWENKGFQGEHITNLR
jgi:hypothetical protein